ncbi:MAG TPA: VOC family protein [Candidatus Cybelea sp.]|jgi:PhnB protein
MQLEPNLVFNGNAQDALEHYRDALGGELEIVRFAGTPAAAEAPPEYGEKVLYGTLRSPLGTINAMDLPPARGIVTAGDNFSIGIQSPDAAEIDAVFAKLSEGGTVMMPLGETFFSPKFGMAVDKFGIRWMLNLQRGPSR